MKQGAQKFERWEKYFPDAAAFLVTAVLFAARLFGGSAPFALGVLAAAGGGRHGLASLLGAAVGAPLLLDFPHALRSLAVAVLLFTANNAFCETRWYRARCFLPVMTALMYFAVEFVYLTQSEPDEAAQCLLSAALTVLTALAAREAESDGKDTARREASRLLLTVALLTAAAALRFQNGFAPARAATMLLVLLFAYDREASLALAFALASGLAMDLSLTPLSFLHTAVYAIGALAVTPERRARRVGAALLWCTALVLLALPLPAETGLVLLYEGLLASLAFLLLPTRLFSGRHLAPPTPEAAEERETRELTAARSRLREASLALREVYESLTHTPRAAEENPASLYDRAAERVCRGCSLRTLCWERDYAKTYNALNDATASLLANRRARGADFPSYFADRCIRFPSFLAAVNAELNAFLLRRQYRDRLADAHAQAAGQYAQLSELLDGTARSIEAAASAPTLLDYRVGLAQRAKEGERVSGDASAVFETPDGSLCLLLSDGMGCGEDARRASSMTVRLLERFLRAGVEVSAALKTLNGALTLRAELEGGFATVDLVTLSLHDGTAQVYKYGAAPSYLKRDGHVHRVTCSCLPAGLQTADAPPERTSLRLARRSFLVLLSDGVADGADDGWLTKLLADFTGDDPQTLADALMAESRRVHGAADDALILAVYLPDGTAEV